MMITGFTRGLFNILIKLRRDYLAQPFFYTVIVLCTVSFLAFAKLASEVLEGEGQAIDAQIMRMMRSADNSADPLGPPWFEEVMRDITGLGGVTILTFITLASAIYLLLVSKKGLALYVLAAVGTGTLFSNLLKIGFDRPRPDLISHETLVYSASFPSGHALLATIVYLTLAALLAEIQPRYELKVYSLSLGIILTFAVGISRIYLGVHWPSDVLAGWLSGSSWAFMCWIVAHFARKPG